MNTNHFPDDYRFGVEKYRSLLELFYQHYCYEGRFVFVNNSSFSNYVQQALKTDTLIQKEAWVSHGVDEKIVRWPEYKDKPHTAFFLETRSCTNEGHESDGWMINGKADKLLYAFEIKDLGLIAYLIDFPRLQTWFQETYLPGLAGSHGNRWVMREKNRTEGVLVEIATVVSCVPTECFLLTFEGTCQRLPPTVDIQQLRARYLRRKVMGPQEVRKTEPEGVQP